MLRINENVDKLKENNITRTVVINLIGGPCSGKSTLAYGLMAKMKSKRHKVEYVPEYAKEITYRRDWTLLANQNAVTTEQDHRLRVLLGQVDWIIHDTALPLGLIYAKEDYSQPWFERRVWDLYEGYRNFTIFVNRVKPYETYGRSQSESEARLIDDKIKNLFGPDRIDLILEGREGNEEQAYQALLKISSG